jgi:hypothetical protein
MLAGLGTPYLRPSSQYWFRPTETHSFEPNLAALDELCKQIQSITVDQPNLQPGIPNQRVLPEGSGTSTREEKRDYVCVYYLEKKQAYDDLENRRIQHRAPTHN